jgi:hypothetical protein
MERILESHWDQFNARKYLGGEQQAYRSALAFDGIFGEEAMESGAADAEFSRRLTDVSAMLDECPLNKFFFNRFTRVS